MRMRSPRAYTRPSNSSKSQPLATTRTRRARRGQRCGLLGDRRRHGADGRDAAQRGAGDARLDRALGPHAAPLVAAVRIGEPGVAEVGHVRHAAAASDGGADQVHRVRRRGREHDVDPPLAHRARAGPHGVREPCDLGVGQQHAAAEQRRAHAERAQRRAPQPGGRPASAHARGRGSARGAPSWRRDVGGEARIEGAPFRVVGREHVDVDAELGQVAAELEHALHAAAAGRREVERHDQDAHRSSRQSVGAARRPCRRGRRARRCRRADARRADPSRGRRRGRSGRCARARSAQPPHVVQVVEHALDLRPGSLRREAEVALLGERGVHQDERQLEDAQRRARGDVPGPEREARARRGPGPLRVPERRVVRRSPAGRARGCPSCQGSRR